ncbi:hypothetical protein [Galbibacter sp. BG1]
MKLSKLPEALVEKIAEASVKIGSERALIALQGLVHGVMPLRIIDGVLRDETVNATLAAVKASGIDNVVYAYIEKIEMRFPGIFQNEDDDLEEEELEDAPKAARRRR